MEKYEYIEKYKNIYKDIPENKQDKAEDLIEKLATLSKTLAECEEHLDSEGRVTEMSQGKYSIMRENPYVGVQDKAMKNFLNITARLDSMLPDTKTEAAAKAGDSLKAFISSGKPKD